MAPSFYHSGGDVVWSGDPRTPLNDADIDYLRRVYRDECFAAHRACDEVAYQASHDLLAELLKALSEQTKWLRCASAPLHSTRRVG